MIQVDNLRKTFKISRRKRRELGANAPAGNTIDAVSEVTFACKPGRVFGLLGPNGAGKTTALRIIATMLKPSTGSVTVAGYDTVTQGADVRASIGFLTGNTGLYDRLTASETTKYQADLHQMDPARYEERRKLLFDLLDMHEFADRRVSRLSTGMRQKVSIARTIIHDPNVVVFDEPTAGLDVMTSRRIVDLIRTCRDEGKTVLFSTHIMGEAQLLCDDLAIIHKGRLFFNGTKQAFEAQMKYDSYEDEFVHLVGEA